MTVQVEVQRYFTPAETVQTITDVEPRTSTSTFTQLPISDRCPSISTVVGIQLRWTRHTVEALTGAPPMSVSARRGVTTGRRAVSLCFQTGSASVRPSRLVQVRSGHACIICGHTK